MQNKQSPNHVYTIRGEKSESVLCAYLEQVWNELGDHVVTKGASRRKRSHTIGHGPQENINKK